MPISTRQLRSTRRAATKRTILSSLDETQPVITSIPEAMEKNPIADDDDGFQINACNKEAIDLLISDLEAELEKKIDSIAMNAQLACEQLNQVGFLNSLQIEKKVKAMTVKEYQEVFGQNVLECVQEVMVRCGEEKVCEEEEQSRKRTHGLETPARSAISGGPMIQRTPLYVCLTTNIHITFSWNESSYNFLILCWTIVPHPKQEILGW